MLKLGLAFGLLGACLGGPAAADQPRPLVAVLGTCSALNGNTYPADALNWFDATQQSQVVFYAHLLFPLIPEAGPTPTPEAWHPPLAISPTAGAGPIPNFVDQFYAQAEWLDLDDKRIALYGMSLSARVRDDMVHMDGRWYVPHTFAMAIGTRDLRREAGQLLLPEKPGLYHVRFSVNGETLGIGFFRMLKSSAAPAPKSPPPTGLGMALPLSPTGLPAALSRAVHAK